MTLKLIKTDSEYQEALKRLEEIFDAKIGTPESDEADILGLLIDEYEKAEIKETRYKNTTDFYSIYLNWGIIFFLLYLLSKSTFISNILED